MVKLEKVGPTHYRLRDFAYGDVRIAVDKYIPYRETECGWWVIAENDWPLGSTLRPERIKKVHRWVPKDSPRFCSPKMDSALYGFKCRKASQLKHLKHKLLQAEQVQKGLELLGSADFPVEGYSCGMPPEWSGIIWD